MPFHSEDLVLGKQKALDLLASGKPLKDVLDVIVLSMENYLQAPVCSILLYDEQKQILCLVSAPSMPTSMHKAFKFIPIGPHEGSCGSAAFHKTLVVIDDIATHPNWDFYRDTPMQEGFRSCWSQPIFSSEGKLLGTFAVYDKQKKQPTLEELSALSSITNLTAIAINYFKMENTIHTQHVSCNQSFSAVNRSSVQKDFIRALERNEFMLYYQPLFHVSTNKVTGAEALIRWNHPQHGLVPPSDFIPMAEDSGMIIPIGEWVITAACQQMKDWEQKGLGPLSISVNISPVQLEETGFEEMVDKVLTSHGVDPQLFSIEITERTFIQPKMVTIIKRLRDLGIRISIDDFGTGYSSLAYLKQLPAHRVKVDRSFIRNIPKSQHDIAITKAIYEMCSTLGFELIAEGVETAEQFQFLCELNCHYIQGYCISQPIPSDMFEKRFLSKL